MDTNALSPLLAQLGSDEVLLWSGRPKQGILLRSNDIFLIPFSILWAGFALFWEYGVVTGGAPFFFMIWGIPFVFMGLYITIGRFFLDARTRANTFYGVTNTRIVILSGAFSQTTKSLNLRTLSDISLEQKGDQTGTITFGSGMPFAAWYRGVAWPGMGNQLPPAFDLIPDARQVYDIIQHAQRQA